MASEKGMMLKPPIMTRVHLLAILLVSLITSKPSMSQSSATTPFTIIEEADASKKYGLLAPRHALHELFDEEEYHYQNYLKGQLFLEVDGDAIFDGDLLLDWEEGFADTKKNEKWRAKFKIPTPASGRQIQGIIINGNLDIRGDLRNCDSGGGPFLYITGDLVAKNVLAGGAYMRIMGNLHASGVLYAHYNDGSIYIGKTAMAKVIISEDHDYGASGGQKAAYYLNTHEHEVEYNDEDELIIPVELKRLLSVRIRKWEEVLPLLCKGEQVLRGS